MAEQILNSDHAEDVGGVVVEPGQPIPADADAEVLERLEAEGKLGDATKSKKGN